MPASASPESQNPLRNRRPELRLECFEVHERAGELDDLAHEAAEDSMLGSGIGMSGQRIAMQMRRLPKGHNVFELNAPRFWQCRNLGANSARAVKKMPFKAIYRGE